MKTKLMYAAVCLLFASVLFAGQGKGRGEGKGFKGDHRGRRHLDSSKDMAKNLGLTADQKVQTDKMSKDFHEKAKGIKDSDLEGPQKREAFMELRKNLEKNIDSVLTPGQRKQAQENRQERKRLRKQNREQNQNREQKQNRKRERKQNKQCGTCPN